VEYPKQVLSFGEDVDFLVVVGHCLVEDVPFRAVVHPFHYLLFPVYDLICLLSVDVAFEVVFVVGLPGAGAHIAEVLAAGAGHEVAAH
jgi:hypothetical protein